MVSVVSSNPTGSNFIFLRHLDANFVQKWQKCQICVIYENLECLCNFSEEAYVCVKGTQQCSLSSRDTYTSRFLKNYSTWMKGESNPLEFSLYYVMSVLPDLRANYENH